MNWIITKTADSTYDTESRSDIPRSLPDKSPAEIGDSITITGNVDRIKVTVLGVVDPAVIKSRGIKGMLARLQGQEEEESENLRCVAVKVRMRNLEEPSDSAIVQGICGGVLFDSEGHEYSSTGDSVENYSSLWAPNRGTQPKVMCDAFKIRQGAKPARYVLAVSSWDRAPAGEWRLKHSPRNSVESERDFGVKEQLQLLETGVKAWNAWRAKHPKVEIHLAGEKLQGRDLQGIDLSGANLERTNFGGSDLKDANLSKAHARSALFPQAKVASADFSDCDLRDASFFEAYAAHAHFDRAVMTKATLEKMQAYAARFCNTDLRAVRGIEASLVDCNFTGARVEGADFIGALFDGAIMSGVSLREIKLTGAYLRGTNLQSAVLEGVSAYGANLQGADLTGATVADSDLSLATLVHAKLGNATIVNTRVFGISAWDIQGPLKQQDEIVITPSGQPRVTVNDLEVANFVYLLLNNEKIRNAIETIGRKGVLILGRFTERKHVLEAIKKEVSRLDLLPIVFDFERPTDRDFTETVMTLAGMSRFIVADITAPKSVPLELEATVPNYMVPFVPLIEEGERPFSMFEDLWKKYRDWVLEPLSYGSVDQLIRVFKNAVVDPANERLELLRVRKAEKLVSRRASDYEDPSPPSLIR
jgi:uncharacterized protein YjbI with pentapeptide repeats